MFCSFKQLICLLLAALFLLSGCTGSQQNPDSVPSSQATAAIATTDATTVPETTNVATGDSAMTDDGDVTYDDVEIKKNLNEIENTLNQLIDRHNFMGTVYAKVGNDFEYIKAKGFANQGAHIENSIYRGNYAGSVTKLFTVVAVMQLAEAKKLRLDDTLDRYFSGCAYGGEVTVRQLLTMTSGIPNYLSHGSEQNSVVGLIPALRDKIAPDDYDKNKATILSWILSQPQTENAAGSFFYSDSNYYLLGEIISAASQMPYETYLSEHVLQPCGMKKTGFEVNDSTARPYESRQTTKQLLYDGVGYASLGAITCISDLLKFIDALTANQLMSEKSLQLMLTDTGSGYGFGVYINGSRASCIGEIDAYRVKLSFTADKSQIFAAMTNYSESDPNIIHRVFRNYLVKYRN